MVHFADAAEIVRARVSGSVHFRRRSWKSDPATACIWREAFGTLDYDEDAAVTQNDTIFDIASLTKVIATTSLDDAAGRARQPVS